jgi:hypothetical protein
MQPRRDIPKYKHRSRFHLEIFNHTHKEVEKPAEKNINNPPSSYYLTTNLHLQFIIFSTKRGNFPLLSPEQNPTLTHHPAALHLQCNARRRLHDGTCI